MIMGTLKLFNIGNMVTYSMNENSMISSKQMEILISDGKIIEVGTHDSLISKANGQYSALWKVQAGSRQNS